MNKLSVEFWIATFSLIILPLTMMPVDVAFAQDSSILAARKISLKEDDLVIYQATFEKCRPGTVHSAIGLAFNGGTFASGLENWLEAGSGNVDAIQARIQNGLLDPSVARLRHSNGFWLALTDCYGYRYGALNYGNLMKQIIDMGHLTSQTGSFMTGAALVLGGAKMTAMALKQFPIASRFILSAFVSLQIGNLINQLRALYFPKATPESEARLTEAQAQAFSEPDKAIANVLLLADQAIKELDRKINNPTTSPTERLELVARREKIGRELETLKKLCAASSY